jgi:hypothetical protein
MERKFELVLNEEQARLVMTACDFYSRMMLGQFQELTYRAMDLRAEDYCERRESADTLIFEARKYIFPELHGRGHSYGVGKFKDADQAYDVFQVIRKGLHPDAAPVFSYQEKIPTFAERTTHPHKRRETKADG